MALGQFSFIPFPDPGTDGKQLDPAMVERFFDQRCDYRSTYRAELMREWTLEKAYLESVQWVRLDVGYDPRRAVRWTEVDPQRQIPKPITNECLPIFDSAVSRIGQRQSKPSIRARNTGNGKEAGSRLAQDVLEWHFEQMEWTKIRRERNYRCVLYGTGILKSYWDLDYRDLVRVGVEGAVQCAAPCPACGGTGQGPSVQMGLGGVALRPDAAPATSMLEGAGGAMPGGGPDSPPVLDPDAPPIPTRNYNLGRPGDQNDIAAEPGSDAQAAGPSKGPRIGGSPMSTGDRFRSGAPSYESDLTGPRQPMRGPSPNPPSKYGLASPPPVDPSYDYSNEEPFSGPCPLCQGEGTRPCDGIGPLASTDISPQALLKVPPRLVGAVSKSTTGISYTRSKGGLTPQADVSYSFPQCPDCGAPFRPYDPTPEEVQDGKDALGRPFGQDIPRGKAKVECVSPFDFFVENEGIDRGPGEDECDEFYQCTPRSLDWLANHYEETEDIKPEDPNIIAQHHPILGEYSFWSVGSRIAAERNVYQNHVRVREAYKKRSKRFPLGRAVVMAGKKVVLDDDLYFESPDQPGLFIPKVNYAVSRYYRKDGEYNGQGVLVPLISLQNRINMTYSQIVDTRERHGTAGIIATRGMRLLGGWVRGFTGRIMVWDIDPQNPSMEPKPFETRLMNDAFPEIANAVDRMKWISGEMDVDVGKAPANVSAASAIQLLQEKSAVRNLERESEMMDADISTYRHQMQLNRNFVREPREFMKKEGAAWEIREFMGIDLAGQTDVVIEDQATYDKRLFTREGIIQAIQLGLYVADTVIAKREALKAMGLPITGTEEQNVQIDDAERKWFNFRDTGYIPTVDEFEDDHDIHWRIYGKYLKSPDGIKIKGSVDWDNVDHLLSGWQDKLNQAVTLNTQIKQEMSQPPPTFPPGTPNAGQPILGVNPVQIPPGYPLPDALEDQIIWVWMQLLQKAQYQAPPELFTPSQTPQGRAAGFLAFMSIVHAHRIYFERRQTQAQGGSPVAAAPMGSATSSGTLPTPNSPGGSGGLSRAPSASTAAPSPAGLPS